MSDKKQFGQFFTTNTDYILKGFEKYIKDKKVIDPFAGKGDLLKWAINNNAKIAIGYDCDKKLIDNKNIFYNNSIENPLKYDFVLTNPPYLYQNKMKNNKILRNSKHTDLYQLSIEKIIDSKEGIVIVPVNFLSAENSKYIRSLFLEKFDILKVNYFKEQVFKDTTYNVIAFYYKLKEKINDIQNINFTIYPQMKHKLINISKKYNWQIGGFFLSDIKKYNNKLKIKRLEESDIQTGNEKVKLAYNHINNIKEYNVDLNTLKKIKNNIVLLKAIDTGSDEGKICLEDIRKYNIHGLISIKTSRNQINLIFPDFISIKEQEELILLFNKELEKKREEYQSLFMTNYRDKDRKRISFNFAYNLLNYLYFNKLNTDLSLF